jgi:phosphoribosylformimino-5-aminoimidazole carboxamide ribotide isomerase
VIASGGLASIADIVRMKMPDAAKLEGAISGRALYDGRIDPAEALGILNGLVVEAANFKFNESSKKNLDPVHCLSRRHHSHRSSGCAVRL